MSNKDLNVVTPTDLGRGIKRDNAKKKYEVDLTDLVDGTTVKYEGGKLKSTATGGGSGGLDCKAIGSLKKTRMDKSITVLGKKGDECVQVAVFDSIFQDVGVGISADKYSGYENDSFNVKITVTNSGEGTNENTTLRITKPQLGSYEIKNQTHRGSGVGKVTKVSDTEYTIKNLAKGGTAVVTFDVIGKSHGTYQFGASVDPDSALDVNASNHRASITLSVNTKADPTYVPTRDCPAITVTDIGAGKQLLLQETSTTSYAVISRERTNYYENSLRGRTFRLDGASTVVLTTYDIPLHRGIGWWMAGHPSMDGSALSFYVFSEVGGVKPPSANPFVDYTANFDGYTFKDGVLTITEEIQDSVTVAMRPAHTDCIWQFFVLMRKTTLATERSATNTINVIDADNVTYNTTRRVGGSVLQQHDPLHIKTIDTDTPLFEYEINKTIKRESAHDLAVETDSVTITVPRLTEATINVTTTGHDIGKLVSKGAVAFTPTDRRNLTIHVSDKAMPTDSLRLGPIHLVVE